MCISNTKNINPDHGRVQASLNNNAKPLRKVERPKSFPGGLVKTSNSDCQEKWAATYCPYSFRLARIVGRGLVGATACKPTSFFISPKVDGAVYSLAAPETTQCAEPVELEKMKGLAE